MTLPNHQNESETLKSCQCVNKNCVDCKCGCSSSCCSSENASTSGCPFLTANPNWQKCPFMSKMFMSLKTDTKPSDPVPSTCDDSKCAQVPAAHCTSCHKAPALNHTVTLSTDTELATDQTEEIVL